MLTFSHFVRNWRNFCLLLLCYWLPLLGEMILIFWLSAQPAIGPKQPWFPQQDKVAHFFFYGALAFLWMRALSRSTSWRGGYIMLCGASLAIVYGILDEYHQKFTGRHFEILDMVADGVGSVSFSWLWLKYRGLLPMWLSGSR